ncbi:hypothetical protein ACFLTZ_01825 [Chloroflexota bacterium]
MIKRLFLAAGVLLLVLPLMVGCGVPQEEFDSVLAEQEAAQGQVVSLQSDLNTVQAQINSLESDLKTAQSQLQTLRDDCKDQEAKIAKAVAYTRAWHILLYKARKQAGIAQQLSYASDTEWMAALMKSVEATGDSDLLNIVKTMERGGPEANVATVRFMHHTTVMTLRSLQ